MLEGAELILDWNFSSRTQFSLMLRTSGAFSWQNCNVKQFCEAAAGQDFLFSTGSVLSWLQWMAPPGGTLGSQDHWHCRSSLFAASTQVFSSWPFAQSRQSWSACPKVFLCQIIKIRLVQIAASHSHLIPAISNVDQLKLVNNSGKTLQAFSSCFPKFIRTSNVSMSPSGKSQ